MKGLKLTPAIVVFILMTISQKTNAQTLPGSDIKPQIQPKIEKLQIQSTPNQDSTRNNQKLKIYFQKGLKLIEQKEYAQAIRIFNEIIKIQPNNQYGYFFRGFSYFRLKMFQQAKVDFDKSIQLDPSISYSYFFRGITNYALGDRRGAIIDLQTATKLFEKDGKTEMAQKSRDVIEHIRNA